MNVTFTLSKFQAECDQLKIPFPKDSFPFMYKAGIAYFAASHVSNEFYSWDPETGRLGIFTSLTSIVQGWIDVMDETNEP